MIGEDDPNEWLSEDIIYRREATLFIDNVEECEEKETPLLIVRVNVTEQDSWLESKQQSSDVFVTDNCEDLVNNGPEAELMDLSAAVEQESDSWEMILPFRQISWGKMEFDMARAEQRAAKVMVGLACMEAHRFVDTEISISDSDLVKEKAKSMLQSLDQWLDIYLVALCDHNSCHVELVGHDLPSKVMDELWQHNDIIEDAKDELREIITGKFGRDTDISEKVDVTEWLEIVSHEPERICSPIRNQHNLPCISQMPDASKYPTMHTILGDSGHGQLRVPVAGQLRGDEHRCSEFVC